MPGTILGSEDTNAVKLHYETYPMLSFLYFPTWYSSCLARGYNCFSVDSP